MMVAATRSGGGSLGTGGIRMRKTKSSLATATTASSELAQYRMKSRIRFRRHRGAPRVVDVGVPDCFLRMVVVEIILGAALLLSEAAAAAAPLRRLRAGSAPEKEEEARSQGRRPERKAGKKRWAIAGAGVFPDAGTSCSVGPCPGGLRPRPRGPPARAVVRRQRPQRSTAVRR